MAKRDDVKRKASIPVGERAWLTDDDFVREVVILCWISYSNSFRKDECKCELTAGKIAFDANQRYEVGYFDCDGCWRTETHPSDRLFDSPQAAFDALREVRET
jgi:hypothetical protein